MGIQNPQKCLGRITQSATEYADALDRAIVFLSKTAYDVELMLGVAHDLSDIDVSRFAHQTNAAVAATDGIEITF